MTTSMFWVVCASVISYAVLYVVIAIVVSMIEHIADVWF